MREQHFCAQRGLWVTRLSKLPTHLCCTCVTSGKLAWGAPPLRVWSCHYCSVMKLSWLRQFHYFLLLSNEEWGKKFHPFCCFILFLRLCSLQSSFRAPVRTAFKGKASHREPYIQVPITSLCGQHLRLHSVQLNEYLLRIHQASGFVQDAKMLRLTRQKYPRSLWHLEPIREDIKQVVK